MTAVLEVNDYELTLYKGAEALYQAPAIAIVRENDMLFGEAALRQFRLFPRQANHQYFAKLNADPLSEPVKRAANHADLVYLHLKELAQVSSDDLVLAVPGTLNGDQLGVLLGICQEAGYNVRGFVDSAVAAVASESSPRQLFHLDVHLQHFVVTELNVDGDVVRGNAEEIRDCGISNLVNGWVNLIADRFVSETRFDPLHTADSEQQLYNQVFDWLNGAHHSGELGVAIASSGSERRVDVARSQLESKALQRYRRVLETLPQGAAVTISARTARIPGFAGALRDAGHPLKLLGASAVGAACSAQLGDIIDDGGALRLISRLPMRHGNSAQLQPEASTPSPTHFLHEHTALPLSAGPATRSSNGQIWLVASANVELNGERVDADTRLRLGDVVLSDGRQLTAIRVPG